MDFLEKEMASYSDLQGAYQKFSELYNDRLWHQLSDALVEFLSNPATSRESNHIKLFADFVSQFDMKIKPLKLVQIAALATRQYYHEATTAENLVLARDMINTVLEKREKLGVGAALVADLELVSLRVKLPLGPGTEKDMDECKAMLKDLKKVLDTLEGVDPAVPAAYYRVASEYYKTRGPPSLFYSSAIRALSYMPIDSMSLEEARTWAQDIALAAMVGKDVFNFGEIVTHPILKSLEGSPNEWLLGLLRSFHTGDIDAFNGIVASHRAQIESQPALAAGEETLKQKVALLAVMETAASKPPGKRILKFSEVAEATRLSPDLAEWVLMRAMSLGLITGKIDEVSETVEVTSVMPRVLDKDQIRAVHDKFSAWKLRVEESLIFMESNTSEIFK